MLDINRTPYVRLPAYAATLARTHIQTPYLPYFQPHAAQVVKAAQRQHEREEWVEALVGHGEDSPEHSNIKDIEAALRGKLHNETCARDKSYPMC